MKPYFLPYQERWLKDNSRLKIWEKSRRIGATYVQAYEDVSDCAVRPGLPVWFSSADESAAKEYILYCEQWVKLLDVAARYLGEVVIDSEKDIKTFVVEFANGARINALRSNPKAFRSKGGKVILDEFGFHDDADALWKAAKPCITWGFPMRILSTHNGKNCRYYHMTEDAKQGRGGFMLHTTDIFRAVGEGLVDKIYNRAATEEDRAEWLRLEKEACQDEDTWLQEYCCVPVDETTAFLSYDLITSCEAGDCLSQASGQSHGIAPTRINGRRAGPGGGETDPTSVAIIASGWECVKGRPHAPHAGPHPVGKKGIVLICYDTHISPQGGILGTHILGIT